MAHEDLTYAELEHDYTQTLKEHRAATKAYEKAIWEMGFFADELKKIETELDRRIKAEAKEPAGNPFATK